MRKRPLQFHLIALVLLAVVPIAAVSSLVFVIHARENQEAAERALIETTRAVAIATEYRVEAEVKRLETVARSARLAVDDLNGFKQEAQNAVFTGQFLEVLLLDPNGYIVLNASTEGLNSSNSRLHDAPYFEMVRETLLPHVSDVVSLPISARKGIVLSVPVLRSGQLAYVLVGAPHTSDKLLDLFSQQRLPPGGIGTIMDRNGVYIARTLNPNESVGRQASASYRAHALRASEGIVKNLNPEGIAVYGTFVHTRHGWITALGLPADQVEAPHLQSIFTMAALWLSTITIGVIAAVLVGRRITASLGRLSEAAVEVGKGSVPASRPEPVSEVDRVRESLIQAAKQRD